MREQFYFVRAGVWGLAFSETREKKYHPESYLVFISSSLSRLWLDMTILSPFSLKIRENNSLEWYFRGGSSFSRRYCSKCVARWHPEFGLNMTVYFDFLNFKTKILLCIFKWCGQYKHRNDIPKRVRQYAYTDYIEGPFLLFYQDQDSRSFVVFNSFYSPPQNNYGTGTCWQLVQVPSNHIDTQLIVFHVNRFAWPSQPVT